LGPKPSGLGYRPDEIELIGWATQKVGQDLHTLDVERFAAIAEGLRQETVLLRQENTTLRSLIPTPAAII